MIFRHCRGDASRCISETEKAFNLGFISMTEAIITVIRFVSLAVIAIRITSYNVCYTKLLRALDRCEEAPRQSLGGCDGSGVVRVLRHLLQRLRLAREARDLGSYNFV